MIVSGQWKLFIVLWSPIKYFVLDFIWSPLPQMKRLAPDDEANVLNYLRLGSNKKLIQSDLISKGKKRTLKDLANIGTNLKAGQCYDLVSLCSLAKKIVP